MTTIMEISKILKEENGYFWDYTPNKEKIDIFHTELKKSLGSIEINLNSNICNCMNIEGDMLAFNIERILKKIGFNIIKKEIVKCDDLTNQVLIGGL